jgi:anionic cell wall polymer biosynthesis LytR-Cps2A-Psr (LCP) family protein
MTRREAALLAYEIRRFQRLVDDVGGIDCTVEIPAYSFGLQQLYNFLQSNP